MRRILIMAALVILCPACGDDGGSSSPPADGPMCVAVHTCEGACREVGRTACNDACTALAGPDGDEGPCVVDVCTPAARACERACADASEPCANVEPRSAF